MFSLKSRLKMVIKALHSLQKRNVLLRSFDVFDLTLNTAGDFFEASAKLCILQPLKCAPLPVLLFLSGAQRGRYKNL